MICIVEFVSYSGKYPCLCSGILDIKVDGKEYKIAHALKSGGTCRIDKNDNEIVESGLWTVYENMLPKELKPYKTQIEDVVNSNVRWGCCGGCM